MKDWNAIAVVSRLTGFARTLELDLDAFESLLDQDIAPLVEQYRFEALALELAHLLLDERGATITESQSPVAIRDINSLRLSLLKSCLPIANTLAPG